MFGFKKKKQDNFDKKYQTTLRKAQRASREMDDMTNRLLAFNQQTVAQYERLQRV